MRQFLFNDSRVSIFVAKAIGSRGFAEHTSLGIERDGQVIGGVVFENYTGQSIQINVAGKYGEQWLSRKFIEWVLGYVFDGIKVKKLIGLVSSGNARAQIFDNGLGFQLETVVKDVYPDGDCLIYSMTREQCKWLKEAK